MLQRALYSDLLLPVLRETGISKRYLLDRMKTEHGHVRNRTIFSSFIFRTDDMCAVLDQDQLLFMTNL